MRYAYEDLSEDQFESLVVTVCSFLFGPSIQPFAKGKDGGRDARFHGTAERHPSAAAPWTGTSVVQAKHTIAINAHFSDADFFSTTAKTSILTDEIPKIKKLRESTELDNYMVFSNRKLSGGAELTIRNYIESECGLCTGSVFLVGTAQLELYLKLYPSIHTIAALDAIDGPLIVDVNDLSSVIEALNDQKKAFADILDDPPVPRTPYALKNTINNMSADYAASFRKRFLSETPQVRTFLSLPENSILLRMYEDTVDEFQLKIIAKRDNYKNFDDVMNYLMDLLFKRDPILSANRRLTRLMLFYMYWNCDIGKTQDAKTN